MRNTLTRTVCRTLGVLLTACCLLSIVSGVMAQTLLKTLTFTGPIAANATAGSTALGANRVDVQGGIASVTSTNNLVMAREGSPGTSIYRDDLFLSDVAAGTTTKMVMTSQPVSVSGDALDCKVMYQQGSRDGYAISTYLGSVGFFTVYKVAGSPASLLTTLGSVNFSPAYVAGHKYQAVIQAVGTPGVSTVITAAVFDLTANPGDPINTTDANPVGTFTYTDTASPFTTGQFAVAGINGGPNSPLIRLYGSGSVTALVTTSPSPFQVFQRSGTTASVSISGKNQDTATHSIEASFNGGAYQTVAASVAANATFTGSLAGQPQGQGTVTVRFVDTPATTATVVSVGIGDVWVIAGQSNASGQGTNNQIYLNGQNVVGGLFSKSNTWGALTDPTDNNTNAVDAISSVAGNGGSDWPLFGSQSAAITKLPIGFIPCAKGGVSITAWMPGTNHQDRTTLYGSMVYRTLLAGGAKGVLWWQGETDAANNMTQSAYVSNMQTIAAAIRADLGVKLIPCIMQNFGNGGNSRLAINAAIAQEWATDTNVLPGPDLSDMVTDNGYHLSNDGNMLTASSRWWAAINKGFYASTTGGTKRRTQ